MDCFNIRATLGIYPTVHSAHEMIYLTKGASASLDFNYGTKIYGFEDTDQLTFMFKQGKTIHWFKMFTYLAPTADTEPIVGKTYYTDVRAIEEDTFQCTATEVSNPEANPASAGYYEEIEGNCSWRDTTYLVDRRFSYSAGEDFEYVTLTLFPSDTMQFEATESGMAYEIAVRLNTDRFGNRGGEDSIIIESQHPVAVIDSIFSKL